MLSKGHIILYKDYLYYDNQQPTLAQYCINEFSPTPCLLRNNMGELVLHEYNETSSANDQSLPAPAPENPPSTSTDRVADDLNFVERASHIKTGHELSVPEAKAVISLSGEDRRLLKALKKINRPDQVP